MELAALDPKDFTMILEALLDRGFEAPFHVTCVGANGAMFMGRYCEPARESDGLDFELVASHSPDGSFEIPINLMFIDRVGQAARVVIGRTEQPEIFSLN